MSGFFIITAMLGMAIILALWTAARLIIWSRAGQNIAGAFLLTAMACTLIGYLYQLVLDNLQAMLFWQKLEIIGLNLVYPAWLIFVLYFTGNHKRVTPFLVFLLALLSAFPIVIAFLPATSTWLVQSSVMVTAGTLHVLKQQLGWVVYVSTSIAQIEGLVGTVFLAKQLKRVRPGYRTHLTVLFTSQLFAFTAIWIEVSGANPFAPFSIFNLSIIPTCIAVSWAIFGLRVGQTIPLMREKVVETMHDGVIILDGNQRTAYINPAASQMFSLFQDSSLGKPLIALVPELASLLAPEKIRKEQGTVTVGEMIYSSRLSVIEDWKGDIAGQVLVLRNETDREHMERTLETRAAEFARLSTFTQGLSLVAAKLAASFDLDQVYETMSTELHRQRIDFLVALSHNGRASYALEYLSLASTLLRQLERLTGISPKGFELPGYEELLQLDGTRIDQAIFYPNLINSTRKIVSSHSELFEQPIMNAIGVTMDSAGFIFPLATPDEEMGILAVWGPSICLDDLSPLSSFAAQVSAAIQKGRLIDNERKQVEELERSNRVITSLTQIASQFEANLNLNQIVETLGNELKAIGALCILSFSDPQTKELTGHYSSVSPTIWRAAEKISSFTVTNLRIPFEDWQIMDPDGTGLATVIDDPAVYASKYVHGIPKTILKQSIRLVGITSETPAILLPLRANRQAIGILVIWGIIQPQKHLAAFTLFGRQIAAAIEKARLITDLEALKSFNEGIVQGVAEAIVIFDGAGQVTFANPAASGLIGWPVNELVGQSWRCFIPEADQLGINDMMDQLGEQNGTGIEITLMHRTGDLIPALLNAQPKVNEGQLDSLLISLVDIRQRVIAEQRLRASNQEKEALLKEIHHRVKNNLQIISSLLNLQSNRLKDPAVVDIFRESQNRVRAMALIHEKLYRSSDLGVISFNDYIHDLGKSLIQAYNQQTRPVRLIIQAEPIPMDIDTAIPCGLIVNELITNSLKHAFNTPLPAQSSHSPWIKIELNSTSNKKIHLGISDNGCGFPTGFDYLSSNSLGINLITSLVRQIGGTLVFSNQEGAIIEIEF